MADVRVFSYLPNPRLFKATIASRLNGVTLEIRGAPPAELKDWLWDYDAHPLSDAERADEATLRIAKKGFSGAIHKTDDFLEQQPFGNVPAAFSGDGNKVGIFESNSIMRIVGRLGQDKNPLYGEDPYHATRIDSFLDASLSFAVESQKYLFAFGALDKLHDAHSAMAAAYETYMTGIDRALQTNQYICGDKLTLADIAYACEITLFALERHEQRKLKKIGLVPLFTSVATHCLNAHAHLKKLLNDDAFTPDLTPFYNDMTMKKVFG